MKSSKGFVAFDSLGHVRTPHVVSGIRVVCADRLMHVSVVIAVVAVAVIFFFISLSRARKHFVSINV